MGKMKYKISSRATILLGRESVSKVDGALIELVKNTYDADASFCYVYFDLGNDSIYIIDNGTGMTLETIENHWMMIGTDNKKENYKSVKNRIKSGEKGIGRFALDRLGSKCEMYTKSLSSNKLILWQTNWSNFEQTGKTIDEIEADYEFLDINYQEALPQNIYKNIQLLEEKISKDFGTSVEKDFHFPLETGTILKISNLRDKWTEKEFNNILNSLGFLLPPSDYNEYVICIQKDDLEVPIVVENEITEEFDYKIFSDFDGENFTIKLIRNEFDLNKFPDDIFKMERFQRHPYRKEDFKKGEFTYVYSISELMGSDDLNYNNLVKEIGSFNFNFTFMKLSLRDDSLETFFYKEISKMRKSWLEQYGGIKIYRDNFLVRPYGDRESDSFDWLGIDARRANNPAGISHPSENWHVRNAQGQGTILISRISNASILDKSSREGIIENEYFKIFKEVILKIISVFEKDRAYIGRTMKIYSDKINEKDKTKKAGDSIAKEILSNKGKENQKNQEKITEEVETLAKAVQYFKEEREELISEIKILRALATNGLITTSIVHDLKGINAVLVNRVENFNIAIQADNKMLIERNLNDIRKNDIFLKSWITVITNQIKKDKRKRLKKNLYVIIQEIVEILEPILLQKKIIVNVFHDNNDVLKRIFISDFESIIYNLIINSIESFEKSKLSKRVIDISLETNDRFTLHYQDNGSGLGNTFKDPYEIFSYGVTSKRDVNGDVIGTGLGMYIVASTIREYNAKYIIKEYQSSFALDLIFPI
ncbi:ATP-binding protein [Metasolibacillus meyeri]|uniref:ATP-binding protein n=1 Tax=Metasolibacillus meyeri TaxID=1071052 RepID=A0AAW9NHU7_9BACL|nr:ATP-binding protein [Metasolibacillus meyeri]MEC1177317.1 ATP-binding protein [Metasolibacillus meyeri]